MERSIGARGAGGSGSVLGSSSGSGAVDEVWAEWAGPDMARNLRLRVRSATRIATASAKSFRSGGQAKLGWAGVVDHICDFLVRVIQVKKARILRDLERYHAESEKITDAHLRTFGR